MKFTDHAAFPAVIIFVFLMIGIALGFFVCWMTAPNRVFVDKQIEGFTAEVMKLEPSSFSINYRAWFDDKFFSFKIEIKDQAFEFSNRKTISSFYEDLETVKKTLGK